jgi:hypothetical protein
MSFRLPRFAAGLPICVNLRNLRMSNPQITQMETQMNDVHAAAV